MTTMAGLPVGDEEARLDDLRSFGLLDTPPEPSFDRITRLAQTLTGVPIALISLVDADRQWFKSEIGLGCAQTPRDVAFCSHAIARSEVMVVPDATRDPAFAANPLVQGAPHIRFYAGAPLRTRRGNALGTLCVIDTVPRALSEAQVAALADLAAMVVAEIELLRTGGTDALTGVHNRAALLREARREFGRARRYGQPLGLIAIGVDRIKTLNDRHGHAAGDAALHMAAQAMRAELRDADCLGRVGGDEFCALLPQTGMAGAAAAARRLGDRLGRAGVAVGGASVPVTASMGVATLRPDDPCFDELMSRAERLLSLAKSAGRNRVLAEDAPELQGAAL